MDKLSIIDAYSYMMIYEYSRSANKSKVTVSCETVKSRTKKLLEQHGGEDPDALN